MSGQAVLIELGQVCVKSGGRFEDGECVCPSDQIGGVAVRQGFDARAGGACTPRLNAGDPSCITRGGFEHVLDTEGMDVFNNECLSLAAYPFRMMHFRIPAEWKADDARPLAKWLDARLAPGAPTFFAKLSAPQTSDVLEILFAATSIDASAVTGSFSIPSVDPGNPDVTSSYRYLHVPSLDALDWALGNTLLDPRPARASQPAADAGALGAVLERAIAETHFRVNEPTQVSTILQRCLGLCDVTQDYSIVDGANRMDAWRTRHYQTGVVYRETLAVGGPDHRRVDGWVVFDLGGEPSLLYRVDYSASRLKPTVFAYDRSWKPLGSFSYDLFPDADQAALVAQAALPIRDGETGVVLCDSGLTFDNAAINASLLTAPHVASVGAPAGSVLGWLDGPTDDATRFLDGVRTLTLGLLPVEVYPKLHGATMGRLLLGQDGAPIRILSTALSRCLTGPDALAFVASDARLAAQTRVVNLSGSVFADAEACEARFPHGLDERFLWVAAAGNSGRRFTPEAPLARCPQALSPRDRDGDRDNLVVVAAVEGADPWPLSDSGSSYADLGADCASLAGNCSGTSNSAPRVARTAALIVLQQGAAISNPMIRMAILLGVTLPARVPPYRSGGNHNPDDALRAAGELVRHGFGTRTSLTASEAGQVLYALYPDHAYADQKRGILAQNGAFAKSSSQ